MARRERPSSRSSLYAPAAAAARGRLADGSRAVSALPGTQARRPRRCGGRVTAADRIRERRARHRQRPLWIRASVALGGFSTLGAGLALLVLPGPGVPLVVAGLGLLALEFRWAEGALERAVRHAERMAPKKRSHR